MRPSFLPVAPVRRGIIAPDWPLIVHDLHVVAAMLAAGMLALWSARAVPRRKVCQADVPAFGRQYAMALGYIYTSLA